MAKDIYGKNSVLSNPVKMFAKTCPHAAESKVAALTEQHHRYIELKKQFKSKQNQNKKTSRQIGDAKRERRSTDQLMQIMQEQSADIKKLKNQLNDIADNILNFFESEQSPQEQRDDAQIKTPELPPSRIYTEPLVSNNKISIKLLRNEYSDWNHYVKSNPAASLYHRIEWKNLIQNVFAHNSYYFYACNSAGKVVGILPLVRLKSKLFGDFMVSMPYFNSGGAIADSPLIEQQLIEEANNHAKSIGVGHIEYRDNITRKGLSVRTEKVNMILRLPDTGQALWDLFSSKLRSQIKRSQREDTQVIIGNKECLNDFYTVFAQNMRDLGTPVYGKSFFADILETFPQNSKIIIIRLGRQPVAAAFLLGDKNMLEIPWASTIKAVNHLSINMLLYWKVLQFAIKNKCLYFDFGRSSKDSGTFRFKQQWGAKPKQQYWHYWLPENAKLPELNPSNPKYKLAITLWKRIPIIITKWLGPYIVKNLP